VAHNCKASNVLCLFVTGLVVTGTKLHLFHTEIVVISAYCVTVLVYFFIRPFSEAFVDVLSFCNYCCSVII